MNKTKINLHKLNAARMELLGNSLDELAKTADLENDIHTVYLPFYAMNVSIKDVFKYSENLSSFIEDSEKWFNTLSDDSDISDFNEQFYDIYPEGNDLLSGLLNK